MELSETYKWQVELEDSKIITRDDVVKNKLLWNDLDYDLIIKVSFVPQINLIPEHSIIINKYMGEKFIKRFGRGFLKQTDEGFKLKEYVHCVVTNKYRFWVFCRGASLVTHKDYEVRV